MTPATTPSGSYRRAGSDPAGGDGDAAGDVPAPTLLMGMLTAVAAGGFVAWALLPLGTTVAGLPLYAVAAVATTLWSGIAFLRRALPTGVLAEGFYLMAVAALTRPTAEAAALGGVSGFIDRPAGLFVGLLVAVVVAGVLVVVGWRLDTLARKTRVRRMRRRVRDRLSNRRAADSPVAGGDDTALPDDP